VVVSTTGAKYLMAESVRMVVKPPRPTLTPSFAVFDIAMRVSFRPPG
jgi:hypothetical protein